MFPGIDVHSYLQRLSGTASHKKTSVESLFFFRKQAYKEKYKELAYRNAFAHYSMPGLTLIMADIAHAGYMNGPFTRQDWWAIIFFVLGWFMLCIGAILWIRSVFTIGAD